MKEWNWIDDTNTKYIGILEIGEDHFEVVETPTHLIFGGACNVGLLQSGYIEKEEDETLQKTLEELYADLEVFYRDGRDYCSRIVCNERM